MENAVLMSVMHRLRDGLEVSGGSLGGQRLIPHQFRQRASLDEVHREERLAIALANVVDGDNVGMLQRRSGTGLGSKSLQEVVAAELAERKQLESNEAVQVKLPGLIDGAHAPLGNLFQHLVIAKLPTRGLRSMILGPGLLSFDKNTQLGPAQLEQALGTKFFRSVPGQFPVTLIANARLVHIWYRSIRTQM
jgi:hypothetical protein